MSTSYGIETEAIDTRLNKLRALLDYLPDSLPCPPLSESKYSTTSKGPTEYEAFLRNALIGPDGQVQITERGQGLLDILRRFQRNHVYASLDIRYWVDALIEAVHKACVAADVTLPLWHEVPQKRIRGRKPTLSLSEPEEDHSPSHKRVLSPEAPSPSQATRLHKRKRGNEDEGASLESASSPTLVVTNLSPPPPSIRRPRTVRTRHPKFWDKRGTVVLQVGSTLFCVDGLWLAKKSEYLAKFLKNLPCKPEDQEHVQEENEGQERIEGCPVYVLENISVEDFEALLSVLEDASEYVLNPQPFPFVASVLRASTTLGFNKLREWAVRESERIFSNDFHTLPMKPLPYAAEALTLARTYDVPKILKRASYELLRTSASEWYLTGEANSQGDGESNVDLSPQDLVFLISVREALVSHWITIASSPPDNFGAASSDETDGPRCCLITPASCSGWVTMVHRSGLFRAWTYDPICGLQALMNLEWENLGYCERCIAKRKQIWRAHRKELWDELDTFFNT